MLQKLLKFISKNWVDLSSQKWVFVSVFDGKQNMFLSKGVLQSSFDLQTTLTKLRHWFVASHSKKAKIMVIDLPQTIEKVNSPQQIAQIDPKEYGIAIHFLSEPVQLEWLLPNTKGVSDAKQALAYIKQKAGGRLLENVDVYRFTTNRLVFKV